MIKLSPEQTAIIQMLERVPELEGAYWAFLEEEEQLRPGSFGVAIADFLLDVAQSLLSDDKKMKEPEKILDRFFGVCAEQLALPDEERQTFIVTGVLDCLDENHPAFEMLRPRLQELFPEGGW